MARVKGIAFYWQGKRVLSPNERADQEKADRLKADVRADQEKADRLKADVRADQEKADRLKAVLSEPIKRKPIA